MSLFEPLRGLHRADVAIVGGGWTGLIAAHMLARQGLRVALLTPAPSHFPPPVATLYQPERFQRIAACHGPDALRAHVMQLQQAFEVLSQRRLCQAIPLHAFARTQADLPALAASQRLLTSLGLPVQDAPDAGGCPFPVAQTLLIPTLTADASTLADALQRSILRHGGRIFADRALGANIHHVYAADGRLDAAQVLLCTGKPLSLTGRLLRLIETRTVIHCRLTAPVPLHTVQAAPDGSLLFLPGSGSVPAITDAARTGTPDEAARTAAFTSFLRRVMPEWPAESLHFRLHARSVDGLPIVGQFRAEGGSVLVAAAAEDFLSAMVAARALSRLTRHRPAPEDLLLRPDRALPRRITRRAFLSCRRARAIASLRLTSPRCSHCSCRLRWLPAARWWGCAWCGSAFAPLGQRLGGPALADADISARHQPGW